mgnify:CR=1 FL=1
MVCDSPRSNPRDRRAIDRFHAKRWCVGDTLARSTARVADLARACELTDEEPTGVYNVGTEEAYCFNEMVDTINDALGTDIDPVYVECPVDGSVHDTIADASKFREATKPEPQSTS